MQQTAPQARVVILTALDVEYRAVRAHLTGIVDAPHSTGTLFEVGDLRDGSCRIAVGLTGSGNTNAAVVAERAIATFQPRALFFVGIAGALHSDLALGDVIFATKVYAYQGGRADDQGFHAAPETWYPAHSLEQLAHRLARTDAWRTTLPDGDVRHLYLRPVAAGEVVLNSAAHPLREQLSRHYADAAAVEMESAGAARAGQLNGALPTLAIRGISDRADGRKYDTDAGGHQEHAMIGAAALAIALAALVPAGESPADPAVPVKQQNITAYGGLAVGALDGNVHLHREPLHANLWQSLAQPATVIWRADRSRHPNTLERNAVELHLVPIGEIGRVPVRRLAEVAGELATVGRSMGLFTAGQALDVDTDGLFAWAIATGFQFGPAGLLVDRYGQRSGWWPLPHDTLGGILDEKDLIDRMTAMLDALMALRLPTADRYAPAVAVDPATMVALGRVRDLPRRSATPRVSQGPLRVDAEESIPAGYAGPDAAAELVARLLAAFRRGR
ncbi:5'-methylthioadenosine/S-adenosylhomocysteine nucleosidase [Dactylosporangium sp. AC04546]|uniref:5'-methylthioadenosine/S-adenosylhomocysteine nucleosidase n=1 Tax=Dactylosporangium sp. AC04546 TaxID=2862460 RepID=UPI001EDE12BD|nr:5'-methylthioadenosine/S-adenosylhomocysteine nucleosidase [Dactylosporangium sp. AC04546]WVK80424.1 5'-methylthioadenosine/S-adenosylhomocysteine nucleosidase [Dactylosporangium sp. AC04546]